jgi:hypothetical protein
MGNRMESDRSLLACLLSLADLLRQLGPISWNQYHKGSPLHFSRQIHVDSPLFNASLWVSGAMEQVKLLLFVPLSPKPLFCSIAPQAPIDMIRWERPEFTEEPLYDQRYYIYTFSVPHHEAIAAPANPTQ